MSKKEDNHKDDENDTIPDNFITTREAPIACLPCGSTEPEPPLPPKSKSKGANKSTRKKKPKKRTTTKKMRTHTKKSKNPH